MSDYVLVYGTLRKGEGNHHVMKNARGTLVETINISGYRMYDLHGGFPAVVITGNKEDMVVTELYNVEDLQVLDWLEGYRANNPEAGLYNRHRVISLHDKPWIYTFNHKVYGNVITDWCNRT